MSIYYGKIKVSGGSGNSNNTWSGTKAEYDALGNAVSDDIYYYVTDDDNDRLPGDNEPVDVNVEPVINEGTKIATITVGEKETNLFAPETNIDIDVIHRYQSTANENGEYSWFEIWPDGWCR